MRRSNLVNVSQTQQHEAVFGFRRVVLRPVVPSQAYRDGDNVTLSLLIAYDTAIDEGVHLHDTYT